MTVTFNECCVGVPGYTETPVATESVTQLYSHQPGELQSFAACKIDNKHVGYQYLLCVGGHTSSTDQPVFNIFSDNIILCVCIFGTWT